MNKLEKYSDDELFEIYGANIEEEIKSRGYKYGWYKQTTYAGVIYIMVNPAFPQIVKIGYADDVKKRLKTLNSNSGLPDPYHVYATYKVKKRLEDLRLFNLIDTLDSNLRHAANREHYDMPPEKAYGILSAIAQINGNEDLLELNPLHDDYIDLLTKPAPSPAKDKPTPVNTKKRPPLTFEMLGITVGTRLIYKDDPSILVVTADTINHVIYQGNTYPLSGLVKMLKKGGSWQGGEYFLYNGKKLTKLREEIEAQKDNDAPTGQ